MDRLRSLPDAITRDVEDGMAIPMGCGLEWLIRFAASREIIRQPKKDLTLIGPISEMQSPPGPSANRKIEAPRPFLRSRR